MKIRENLVLRKIGDEFIIIPTGFDAITYQGLMSIDKFGALLWHQLIQDTTFEHIVDKVIEIYDVDETTARRDVKSYLDLLNKYQVLENV
ncbi:MAG: PqqD family protein [Erysipelotrichaceae bacterium]|nr:PqqD family protein [Erysipelotrichaceae bacterium]